jgi:DNA-binding transcriptional ArsR family regulator
MTGPKSVTALGSAAGLGQPQTSKHLRVLRNAGLVAVTPDGRRRMYALRPARLEEIDAWLQRFRAIWEARFDQLDQLLSETEDDHEE